MPAWDGKWVRHLLSDMGLELIRPQCYVVTRYVTKGKGKQSSRVVVSSPPVEVVDDSDEEQTEQPDDMEEHEDMQVDELSEDQDTSAQRPSKVRPFSLCLRISFHI